LRLLLVALVAASLLAVAESAAAAPSAAPSIKLTTVDCAPEGHEPGAFDIIRLENHGDAAQDLAGWQLKSDPEDSEEMALDVAGTLVPLVDANEDRVYIVAGRHSEGYPDRKTYRWSISGILRDSGDPPDYVRLYDASGNLVDSMDCNQQPVPLATAAPATPTPASHVSTNQQSTDSTQSVGQNVADSQQGPVAGAAQAGGGSQAAVAPAGAAGAAVPAPDSGVGSLAPVGAGSPLFAFGALAAGLAGIATSGILLLRRGVRRR
jgi:hypothetical protein